MYIYIHPIFQTDIKKQFVLHLGAKKKNKKNSCCCCDVLLSSLNHHPSRNQVKLTFVSWLCRPLKLSINPSINSHHLHIQSSPLVLLFRNHFFPFPLNVGLCHVFCSFFFCDGISRETIDHFRCCSQQGTLC